ncbi:SWIM-type domain-containing protein [Mycena venus]|uniref:SWIM-type domain-containing protein n=1 Tax=Mycena venus TaxID=2733690 RepID=A0A8H6X426_9AGAR|nr:SWIM-type domain-containing protein [Mycena venus]
MDPEHTPNEPSFRKCSQSKCNHPADEGFGTCAKCRTKNTEARRAKRARAKETEEARKRARPDTPDTSNNHEHEGGLDSGDEMEENQNTFTQYKDHQALFSALRDAFKSHKHVDFRGTYQTPEDPLMTDKEHVKMTIYEIWKVTGYRFRVKDNKAGETGHRTRLWCCQDKNRKQKARPSVCEGVKHRDTLGMHRFDCKSRLRVSSLNGDEGHRKISISLRHLDSHVPYYDVSMPAEATAIIREGIEWSTPVQMVGRIQELFSNITATQVHSAWTEMSQILWKRDDMKEFGDDVDVLDIQPAEGVEQVAWVMKKIMEPLRGKVVEIGLDATYGTNSKHLELYTVLGEYDNAGFPLSYCLLSTADSIDIGKRKAALEAWAQILRDKYGVIPVFVHVDKDMAEIGMIRSVWDAKIQLCLWHLKRAVCTRLDKRKLSTTPYNAHRAHAEFPFIDVKFKPAGRADPTEYEGRVLESPAFLVNPTPAPRPHAVTIKLPPTQPRPTALMDTTNLDGPELCAENNMSTTMEVDKENDNEENGKRTFCPSEFREPIITSMERHLNAHPLIPGYSHPSPEGIREWAVKQMYTFCFDNDLPEAWAYLWENWYRSGRWELWARSGHPQIPRLKTTMMVESHWRRIKRDFLHHFHKPRLDLLVWILVKKLAPRYYRRLELLMIYKGRDRELTSWRKDFKAEWKRCRQTPITLPLNEKYRPDPYKWVTRNRTSPFWTHPSLRPLEAPPAPSTSPVLSTVNRVRPNEVQEDIKAGATFDERLTSTLEKIRDFCDGLEYQRQFHDSRMLATLEREGSSFF